jgi:hypothetical protein
VKRAWATSNATANEEGQLFPNPGEGSESAQSVAIALAAVADAEFIRSVLTAKNAMDQFGGQYVIAAKRAKIDVHGRIDNENGAERVTIAYAHAYQHVADVLKDQEREPDSKPHQIDFIEGESNGNGPDQPLEDLPEEAEAEQEPAAA